MDEKNFELFDEKDFLDKNVLSVIDERFWMFYSCLHMLDEHLGLRTLPFSYGFDEGLISRWSDLIEYVGSKIDKDVLHPNEEIGATFLFTFGK